MDSAKKKMNFQKRIEQIFWRIWFILENNIFTMKSIKIKVFYATYRTVRFRPEFEERN
jgi:hypothetical protein